MFTPVKRVCIRFTMKRKKVATYLDDLLPRFWSKLSGYPTSWRHSRPSGRWRTSWSNVVSIRWENAMWNPIRPRGPLDSCCAGSPLSRNSQNIFLIVWEMNERLDSFLRFEPYGYHSGILLWILISVSFQRIHLFEEFIVVVLIGKMNKW